MGTPDRRVRTRRRTVGVIVGVALLVAGCSGDDDAEAEPSRTTTTEPAPTTTAPAEAGPTTPEEAERAAFLAAGNEICGEMVRRTDAIEERYGPAGPASAEDVATAMDETAVVLVETLTELRALTPPAGEEETVEALYVLVDELVTLAGEASDAATTPDLERFRVLAAEIEAQSTTANEAFIAYGLDVCAG